MKTGDAQVTEFDSDLIREQVKFGELPDADRNVCVVSKDPISGIGMLDADPRYARSRKREGCRTDYVERLTNFRKKALELPSQAF